MEDSNTDRYQESETKPKPAKKKEEKRLARLVQKKLEDYMNKTKREEHFDPAGVHRTTPRMYKYDLMYKVIEATALEKSAKEKNKAHTKSSKKGKKICPKLETHSRQVTRQIEALKISESVTKVLEEVPVKDLTSIHSYKLQPTRRGVHDSEKDVRYQGYTSHVGSILQSKKYVDYYIEQGLNTGNPELSSRLKDLKQKERRGSVASGNSSSTPSSGSGRQPEDGVRRPTDCKGMEMTQAESLSEESEESPVEVPVEEAESESGQRDEQVQTSRPDSGSSASDLLTSESSTNDLLTSESTANDLLTSESTPNDLLKSENTANDLLKSENTASKERADTGSGGKEEQEEGAYSDDFEEDNSEDENKPDDHRKKGGDKRDSLTMRSYVSLEHTEEVEEE